MVQEIPRKVTERIFDHVMKDLKPSWLVSHTKVAIASIVGGLLSLLVCGQFGLGFTDVANSLNHTLHFKMGAIPCAILCGTLYAFFPVAVLRFGLCHPLQFRAIMKHRWQAIVVWFGGFGVSMASVGHHGTDILVLAGWLVGAILAANLLAQIMYGLVPNWDFQERFRALSRV
jgi:hypothetical protein